MSPVIVCLCWDLDAHRPNDGFTLESGRGIVHCDSRPLAEVHKIGNRVINNNSIVRHAARTVVLNSFLC